MGTMIMNTIQVLTTLFLLIVTIFFSYSAYAKSKNKAEVFGNIISAFFMLSAIFLIWKN